MVGFVPQIDVNDVVFGWYGRNNGNALDLLKYYAIKRKSKRSRRGRDIQLRLSKVK